MSGLDKNRRRSLTVSFRVSPEEHRQLEARIKVSGMPKGQYFIESLLHQNLSIAIGKYQSDRLSLEFKKLRETLENISDNKETEELLKDCKALLIELKNIVNCKNELLADDFKTKKMP